MAALWFFGHNRALEISVHYYSGQKCSTDFEILKVHPLDSILYPNPQNNKTTKSIICKIHMIRLCPSLNMVVTEGAFKHISLS